MGHTHTHTHEHGGCHFLLPSHLPSSLLCRVCVLYVLLWLKPDFIQAKQFAITELPSSLFGFISFAKCMIAASNQFHWN